MRRRFIFFTAAADLLALLVAVLVASFAVYRTVPWMAVLPRNASLSVASDSCR